ncbi:MAG: hypothetical protein HQ568_02970 [Calditrichaeota bacterium]|nr:hypothetical protein [Calditrichota bacterium]
MIVLLCMVSCTVSVSIAGNPEVVVNLKDGNEIRGTLIELISDHVKIDPEGPLSLQVFYADDISFVYFIKKGEKIAFPLDSQNSSVEIEKFLKYKKKKLEFETRKWSIIGAYGKVGSILRDAVSFSGSDNESNTIIQLGIRYHFNKKDPTRGGGFAELSYHRFNLKPISNVPYSESPENENLVISRVSYYNLNIGYASRNLGRNSYLHFTFGVSKYRITNTEFSDLQDGYIGIGFGLGCVIGIYPRFSIITTAAIDITYTGTRTDWSGQEVATSDGGIVFFTVGILYDLHIDLAGIAGRLRK